MEKKQQKKTKKQKSANITEKQSFLAPKGCKYPSLHVLNAQVSGHMPKVSLH